MSIDIAVTQCLQFFLFVTGFTETLTMSDLSTSTESKELKALIPDDEMRRFFYVLAGQLLYQNTTLEREWAPFVIYTNRPSHMYVPKSALIRELEDEDEKECD